MKKTKNYQDELIEALKNHDEAVAYLNAAMEEAENGDEESQEVFLMALRNIAKAQSGMGALAKKAHVTRESLYKTLSPHGNPELKTLTALLRAMGIGIRFC